MKDDFKRCCTFSDITPHGPVQNCWIGPGWGFNKIIHYFAPYVKHLQQIRHLVVRRMVSPVVCFSQGRGPIIYPECQHHTSSRLISDGHLADNISKAEAINYKSSIPTVSFVLEVDSRLGLNQAVWSSKSSWIAMYIPAHLSLSIFVACSILLYTNTKLSENPS